jgi:hypothetical protein
MIGIIVLLVVALALFVATFRKKPVRRVAIVACIKDPKNIETWFKLHRDLGISRFYVRLEETPDLVEYFQAQPDVYLQMGDSAGPNPYTDLMTRQAAMIDLALELAKKDGIDWLIHIDCDEVLEGNLDEVRSLPRTVGTFWMQNHEAVYNNIPTSKDNCFKAAKFKDCSTDGCASYANGKGGGRVGVAQSNGPHRFKSDRKEVKLRSLIVKHFESCDFDQYIAKYKRLANSDTSTIPFDYYKDSILANGDPSKLAEVYKRYRVVSS